MMKIYQLGDELCDWDLNEVSDADFEWLIHDYEIGCYDGSGQAVALGKDGRVWVKDLGHCSCYGPMDSWETGCSIITVEELLREKDDVHDIRINGTILSKAKELLG